jgi:hypothetical protein
MTALASDK